MIAFVMPHRDREEELARTLAMLGALDVGPGEVIVADNASRERPRTPRRLENGLLVRRLDLSENMGAAARNVAVEASDPRCEWVVMLDDDSAPLDAGFMHALARQDARVGAVMADIVLSDARGREQGGLPEVFIGCGVAIRRRVFLDLGGYDHAFNYYVEEYDLAARMIAAGWRVVFDPAFRVEHRKVSAGRDMDAILHRLVRNNGWVIQRYAPEEDRRELLRETRRRYRAIARKEQAGGGFGAGLVELRQTIRAQARMPMPRAHWDRFTGLSHAYEAIEIAWAREGFRSAAIVDAGKNAWCVVRALQAMGVVIERDEQRADVVVPGTMSPGPMIDSALRWRDRGASVVTPWMGAWAIVPPGMRRGAQAA
ncbi:MAG: glycosyltransferase [Phycisphaerales bacterium]|nr:glycosyltransferase [Phycisphaerales bacterium]